VVVVNLSNSQNKARDAKMGNDLEQISNAAEIIRMDSGTFFGASGVQTVSGTVYKAKDLSINSTGASLNLIDGHTAASGYPSSVPFADYLSFVDNTNAGLLSSLSNPLGHGYWWATDGTGGNDTGKYVVYAQASKGSGNLLCWSGKHCDFTTLSASTPSPQ
jgi:hypothetical protein